MTDPRPNLVKKRWRTVASEGANETSVRGFFSFFFSFLFFFFLFFLVRPLFWARSLPSRRVGRGKKKDRLQTPVVRVDGVLPHCLSFEVKTATL